MLHCSCVFFLCSPLSVLHPLSVQSQFSLHSFPSAGRSPLMSQVLLEVSFSSLPLFSLRFFLFLLLCVFFGVMLWVSVKRLETICIVIDAIQIKLNWIELNMKREPTVNTRLSGTYPYSTHHQFDSEKEHATEPRGGHNFTRYLIRRESVSTGLLQFDNKLLVMESLLSKFHKRLEPLSQGGNGPVN